MELQQSWSKHWHNLSYRRWCLRRPQIENFSNTKKIFQWNERIILIQIQIGVNIIILVAPVIVIMLLRTLITTIILFRSWSYLIPRQSLLSPIDELDRKVFGNNHKPHLASFSPLIYLFSKLINRNFCHYGHENCCHVEPWPIWLPCRRQHFQNDLLQCRFWFTETYSELIVVVIRHHTSRVFLAGIFFHIHTLIWRKIP